MTPTSVIGKKVKRTSGKPFRSGLMENTITDVCIHPAVISELAFTFAEDDSVISVNFCEVV